MTRSEHATNLQLAASAQRVHVGAHFAKRGPVRPVFAAYVYAFDTCSDCGAPL